MSGKSYSEFKSIVADAVVKELLPIQEKYFNFINSEELDKVLDEGKAKASYFAHKMITKVKRKVGVGRK